MQELALRQREVELRRCLGTPDARRQLSALTGGLSRHTGAPVENWGVGGPETQRRRQFVPECVQALGAEALDIRPAPFERRIAGLLDKLDLLGRGRAAPADVLLIEPPALIKTPLPKSIVRFLDKKLMSSITPFGMIKSAPFCTLTFAGALKLLIKTQSCVIIQSIDTSGVIQAGGFKATIAISLRVGVSAVFPSKAFSTEIIAESDKIGVSVGNAVSGS